MIQQEIFTPDCNSAGCHDVAAAGGIRLDEPLAQLRQVLLGPTIAVGAVEPNIVTPGDPVNSRLVTIMANRNPDGNGGPMPPSFPSPPCDVETISQWILDGAPEN